MDMERLMKIAQKRAEEEGIEIPTFQAKKWETMTAEDKAKFKKELREKLPPSPMTAVREHPSRYWTSDDYYSKSYFGRISQATGFGAICGFLIGQYTMLWYPDGIVTMRKGKVVTDEPLLKNLVGTYFSRVSRPVVMLSIYLGVYSSVECLTESLRGEPGKENPWWDSGAGGLVSGALIGAAKGSFTRMVYTGLFGGLLCTISRFGIDQSSAAKKKERREMYVETVNEHTYKNLYPEYKDL